MSSHSEHTHPVPGTQSTDSLPHVDGVIPLARVDLAEIRGTLPQFIDALTDAVLMIDRNRSIVAANRRYVDVFGRHSPSVIGSMCDEAVDCPELNRLAGGGHCTACQVIDLKEPRRLLRTLPDATGVLRRWEATLNPVIDEEGEVSHVVEVWRDITERTQLEGQLAHSERLASLGILAAGVAHEINNPMAAITTGVESLRRWLDRARNLPSAAAAEADQVLTILESAVRRCCETTNKLLLLAQPYQTSPSWVDLNRAARDTLSLLAYQMRQQKITAHEELDPELPAIWAREAGLRGICMNLCLNAVQAMREGGRLHVRTQRHGDRVILEIIDTGPGIHPAHLERIWDPFFTTKPAGQGTGLGLSITHQVVRRNGGTIRVESRFGQGSRFIVELPIAGGGGEGG